MKTYTYKSYDENNKTFHGTINANNKKEAIKSIKNQNIEVINIKEKRKFLKRKTFKNHRKLYLLSIEMKELLKSGIPLFETLDILKENLKKDEKEVIDKIKNSIDKGYTISESIKLTQAFPKFFISLIKIGEESGTLPYSLEIAANYYKKENEIKKKMLELLTYPTIVILFSSIVLYIIITNIIPIFYNLYKDIGIELPYATKVIFNISFFIKNFSLYILVAILLLFFMLYIFLKSKKGNEIKNEILFKTKIIKNIFTIKYSTYLATLSKSGYTIYDSLLHIKNSLENEKSRKIVKKIIDEIDKGNAFEKAMENTQIFDKTTLHLVHSGIESGKIVDFLELISKRKENQILEKIFIYKNTIQPLILLLLGIITAIILLSIWLPMINILAI